MGAPRSSNRNTAVYQCWGQIVHPSLICAKAHSAHTYYFINYFMLKCVGVCNNSKPIVSCIGSDKQLIQSDLTKMQVSFKRIFFFFPLFSSFSTTLSFLSISPSIISQQLAHRQNASSSLLHVSLLASCLYIITAV